MENIRRKDTKITTNHNDHNDFRFSIIIYIISWLQRMHFTQWTHEAHLRKSFPSPIIQKRFYSQQKRRPYGWNPTISN